MNWRWVDLLLAGIWLFYMLLLGSVGVLLLMGIVDVSDSMTLSPSQTLGLAAVVTAALVHFLGSEMNIWKRLRREEEPT